MPGMASSCSRLASLTSTRAERALLQRPAKGMTICLPSLRRAARLGMQEGSAAEVAPPAATTASTTRWVRSKR